MAFPKWRNFLTKGMLPLEIFVLRVFVFSEIEMVMINWYQTFLSSNSVCNYTTDYWLQTQLDSRQSYYRYKSKV